MSSERQMQRGKIGRRGFTRSLGELLFVFIPFIVLFAFKWREGTISSFFLLPEWSFASTYLIGQSIVNYHSGTTDFKQHIDNDRDSFITIILIMFLIVVLCTLFFVLDSGEGSWLLATFQILLFLISVIVFVSFNVFLRILNDPSLTLKEKIGVSPTENEEGGGQIVRD